jgi:hypothetical protein
LWAGESEMIDEKDLDRMCENLNHFERIPMEHSRDIIRLARLGLEFEEFKASRSYFNGWPNWKHLVELGKWAEQYSIDAINISNRYFETIIGIWPNLKGTETVQLKQCRNAINNALNEIPGKVNKESL